MPRIALPFISFFLNHNENQAKYLHLLSLKKRQSCKQFKIKNFFTEKCSTFIFYNVMF